MRRAFALAIAATVAVTGCSFSSVDPDAAVHISGRALDASGKPLDNTQVLLFKQADIGEVILGSVLAVGTLATICLLPDAPAICNKAEKATTDADGRYSFDISGEDTQGTLGTESTMSVTFSAGRSRTSTTVTFTVEENDVSLPEARLWNPKPRVSSNGAVRLSWSPLRGAGKAKYSALLYDERGSAVLWSQPASGDSASIDARIVEGRPGTAAVGATVKLSGAHGTGEAQVNYLSDRLPVRGGSGTPLSRGKRCAAVTGTGPVKQGPFGSCDLTDGNLGLPAGLQGDGVVTGAAIDLGARRPVDLVVGRGFSGQVLLEVSDDNKTYRVVAIGSGTAVALEPNAPTSARYVRLRSPSGLDQSLAYEMSVW